MIEHIKQIGLFMIVTQTFIHVAAGKQYEKYVKIIAGVIVLLLVTYIPQVTTFLPAFIQ